MKISLCDSSIDFGMVEMEQLVEYALNNLVFRSTAQVIIDGISWDIDRPMYKLIIRTVEEKESDL